MDHTDGVDSLTTERNFVLRPKEQLLGGVPAAVHAIIQKDKNTTLIQVTSLLPLSTSLCHTIASLASASTVRVSWPYYSFFRQLSFGCSISRLVSRMQLLNSLGMQELTLQLVPAIIDRLYVIAG